MSVVSLLVAVFFVSLLVSPIMSVQQNVQTMSSQGVISWSGKLGWLHTDGKYIKDELENVQTISSQGVISGGGKLGWLHTDGKHVKNEAGQIVWLRGAAVVEPNSGNPFGVSAYWGQEDGSYAEPYGYLPNSFDLLKSSGVTCVRLAVNWYAWLNWDHPYNPLLGQSEEYKQAVDMFVQELANRGIYCYIDHHSSDMYESAAAWQAFVDNQLPLYWQFWQEVTERYKNQPAVMGCELLNEPRDFFNSYPYQGYWWDFCLEAAQKIHAVNPNLLILAASTDRTCNGTLQDYPYDAGYKVVGDQFVNNPLPEPNILYIFHGGFPMHATGWNVYNTYVAGNLALAKQQWEAALYNTAFRAVDAGLPIMNCEFNVKHHDYMTYEELPYPYLTVTTDFLDLMNKYGCQWTWWAWGGGVGYPWDYSPESGSLVYSSEQHQIGAQTIPIWDTLSYIGEVWKDHLTVLATT